GVLGDQEDRVHAGDQVDARGDHGGRVDEGGDGGRALHRVREPDVEGELRRLAEGADHQEQGDALGLHRDGGEVAGGGGGEVRLELLGGEDLGVLDGAEVGEGEPDAEGEAEVADAVDDEGLLGGGDGRGLLVEVADEQ